MELLRLLLQFLEASFGIDVYSVLGDLTLHTLCQQSPIMPGSRRVDGKVSRGA
jgi:hypothetical protein